jgi:hypothetical protein
MNEVEGASQVAASSDKGIFASFSASGLLF